jgi:DNA-binding NarL/FixJ family response regulator
MSSARRERAYAVERGRSAAAVRLVGLARDDGGGAVTRPVRVVIADDHPLFLDGLVAVLGDHRVEVAGVATSGEEALALVQAVRPDVALLDLRMPGMEEAEAARRIVAEAAPTPVLVLTPSDDHEVLLAALDAGAAGYVAKEAEGVDIARAILAAARGGQVC